MKYLINNIFLWEIVTDFLARIKKIYSGREEHIKFPPGLLPINSNKYNHPIFSLGKKLKILLPFLSPFLVCLQFALHDVIQSPASLNNPYRTIR